MKPSRMTSRRRRNEHIFMILLSILGLLLLLQGCSMSGPTSRVSDNNTSPQSNNQQSKMSSVSTALPDISLNGKTIEVIINFSAGGPTDMFGRLIVRHLTKHLPGTPTVVVKNVPGAGGIIGTNTVFNAKPDGSTIAVLTTPLTQQIVNEKEANYKAEDFTWLGGVSESSVIYAKPQLGLKEPADLLNPKEQIIFGGLGQIESRDFTIRNVLEYLDVNYKYVTGYPGSAEVRQAFASGEINFSGESLTGYFSTIEPWVQEGSASPFLQYGLVDADFNVIRDDRVKELPTITEAMYEIKGDDVFNSDAYDVAVLMSTMNTLQRAIVGPPGMSEEMTEVWRKAMLDTFSDPEFNDEARHQIGINLITLNGEDAQKVSQSTFDYINKRPATLERLKKLAGIQ